MALVLGSGFDRVKEVMRVERRVPFDLLPGFARPGVQGHAGELLLAKVGGLRLLVSCGRAHFYEGLPMEQVMFPVLVLAKVGVAQVLLTNAAGAINARYSPGDFMMFSDHINFTGVNPVRGFPRDEGKCFVDLTEAYSPDLRAELRAAARKEKITLHEGVYIGVSGPTYETPAEIRAFRKLGADAVGMSTVPEVLAARYCGLKVAAVSCITNRAAGIDGHRLSHEEVLAVGRQNTERASRLIVAFAREHAKNHPTKEESNSEKV
jgi:inosine/guanosine/xanthosine phosphorylase family protein